VLQAGFIPFSAGGIAYVIDRCCGTGCHLIGGG
jgi:hypothetical protein